MARLAGVVLMIVFPLGCGNLRNTGSMVIPLDDSGNLFVTDPGAAGIALGSLEEFADTEYLERQKEAADPDIGVKELEKLAEDDYYQVRSEVVANPNTPVQVLLKLSKDRHYKVRMGVARNPKTPQAVLIALSKDLSYSVRGEVAATPRIPSEILYRLVQDRQPFVRSGVSLNPNISLEIQFALAGDIAKWSFSRDYDFEHVCQGLRKNKNADPQALEIVRMSDKLRSEIKRYWEEERRFQDKVEDDYGNKYWTKELIWRARFANKNSLEQAKMETRNSLNQTLKLVSDSYPNFLIIKKIVGFYKPLQEVDFKFKYERFSPPVYEGQDNKYYK